MALGVPRRILDAPSGRGPPVNLQRPSQQRHPLLPVPTFSPPEERDGTRTGELFIRFTLTNKIRGLVGSPCKLRSGVIAIMRCRLPTSGGADAKQSRGRSSVG